MEFKSGMHLEGPCPGDFDFIFAFQYDHVTPVTIDKLTEYFSNVKAKMEKVQQVHKPFHLKSGLTKHRETLARKRKSKQAQMNDASPGLNSSFTSNQSVSTKGLFFNLDPNSEEVREEKERRAKHFDTAYGLCGIDIETYVEKESNFTPTGNFTPYLLSIVGTLQKLEVQLIANGSYTTKVVSEQVQRSFWGEDCVQQFVDFLIAGKYFQSHYVKDERTALKDTKYSGRVRNVFFAHNGFRFDYRFLYEELFKRLGFFSMVGDVSSTK